MKLRGTLIIWLYCPVEAIEFMKSGILPRRLPSLVWDGSLSVSSDIAVGYCKDFEFVERIDVPNISHQVCDVFFKKLNFLVLQPWQMAW